MDVQRAAESSAARGIGFAWGFAEATLFFVVPDVWLGWVALVARRAVWAVLAFTLVGALAGGAVTYAFSTATAPETSTSVLDGVPTVKRDAIDRVDEEMEEHGPRSVLIGPLRMGTPYKLYARAAGVQDVSLASFFLWSVPGRLERMLIVVLLGLVAGTLFRGWIASRPRTALAVYLSVWTVVYTAYVARIGI